MFLITFAKVGTNKLSRLQKFAVLKSFFALGLLEVVYESFYLFLKSLVQNDIMYLIIR